ncbi:hypothetical protein [Crassaminicella profunda]|uniref:hypothetical protein n=1 Tax=Crassaminicella profunda TaxID=1286698 RepID=UPI001CA68E98|nr:hypothetical protein [Crassaminicella profunda]QZY56973.1 hypothetical protein K7H06_08660 [Crassaminicella profunda]
MKKYFENRGSIVINSFIISTILLLITISTLTLFLNDFYIVKANENSLKAYYLGEAAVNIVIFKINDDLNKLILEYLKKLKTYKTNYIQKNKEEYIPPSFELDLQTYLSSQIPLLNDTKKNPFSYMQDHKYTVHIKHNYINHTIDILSTGIYNGAKKSIHVHLLLPRVKNNGVDAYNLPKIKILPLTIENYYQTLGQ